MGPPSVFANSISPVFMLLPGMTAWGLLYALPATILVSILERPFVLQATGLSRRALWYSIQANFVSLVLGYGLLLFGVLGEFVIVLMPFVSVAVSILSEGFYLQCKLTEPKRLRWRWIIAGNAFSSAILVLIWLLMSMSISQWPSFVEWAELYHDNLVLYSSIGCVAVFLLSFILPLVKSRKSPGASQLAESPSQDVSQAAPGVELTPPEIQ